MAAISTNSLLQNIKRDLVTATWDEAYRPPEKEAENVPGDVELQGFIKDGQSIIVGRLQQELAGKNTVDTNQLGDILTAIAYEQQPASAGTFLRLFSLELRERYCPDYIKNKLALSGRFSQVAADKPVAELLQAVKDETTGFNEDHQRVLDQVQGAKLSSGNVTNFEELAAIFDREGQDFYDGGDDFMADIADDLKDAARSLQSTSEPDYDTEVSKIRAQEQDWGKPLAGLG